jgi:hypothetical protein
MKEIIISSKYKKEDRNSYSTIVDDDIYDFINNNQCNVSLFKNKNKENKYYANIKYRGKLRPFHIFIYGNKDINYETQGLDYKSPEGYVIDHINGNGLDNRRENLRETTRKKNCQNRDPKNNYKGVYWNKNIKKWNSKYSNINLGFFDTEEKAARKYDEYLIVHPECGDRLNFEYTEEEKQFIKDNYIEKEKRQLPDNICKIKSNTYRVKITNKEFNIKYYPTFQTLEKAIENRDKKLKEIEQLKKEKIYNLPITYNEEGIAYIEVKYKERIEKCLVDDDKWHELMLISSWSLRNDNSINGNINKETITLHRYLYKKYKNNNNPIPDDMIIDHHKGKCEKTKKLDNRLSNLRMINYEQNSFNRISKNSTGYRGVYKAGKKWIAQLTFEGKKICSKVCSTVEEAALEWNNIVLRTWGEKYGREFVEENLNKIKTELKFID